MAEKSSAETTPAASSPTEAPAGTSVASLAGGTYEIIRQRLQTQGAALRASVTELEARRQAIFGSVEFKLLQADRVTTSHNCVPRDMVQLDGDRFLFGFNVQFGLKKDIDVGDVFAVFRRDRASKGFREDELNPLQDPGFITDFKRLYNVYARASFSKFSLIQSTLFMVFQVGAKASDLAAFKWTLENGRLQYIDGRSEAEFRKSAFPPRYDFQWKTPDREAFRYGDHPHISIEDRVFVECVGGDLTIKVEDNTDTGEGVYAEAVDDRYQKVDDAEFAYVIWDPLVLLRIRPYKETAARYFIFNQKQQSVVRVDSIGQSCAFLPEDHGLIFPDGYYLTTGELKRFESKEDDMVLERVVHATTGEDSLYVFYNQDSGLYVLMPYRLIPQKVEERITCHGFCMFPDGNLLTFRGDEEPQKHHTIQLRQTPFFQKGNEPAGQREAFLYQVGNKDVVRCLAECNEILTLISRENPYAELYTDLVKRCEALLDSYPWLSSSEGADVSESLRQVRDVADKAVEEFDKVRRLQREAVQRLNEMRSRCTERFQAVRRASFRSLEEYVGNLTALRQIRGELISLRDVRYIDLPQIELLEKEVVEQTEGLAKACARFLLEPAALEPYRKQAGEHRAQIEKVTKVADGRKVERAISNLSTELELLIEIVNSLRIEDATETTRIIDTITAIYSTINQAKAALKKRLESLAAAEGAAQFSAQMKLLSQSAASYLDLCDSPAKCEEYLNRVTVQIEEMEGAFAGFEEYIAQLTDRRAELYQAFEQRKVALVEKQNRKTASLMNAAERILKVVQNRLAGFKTIEEINTYMVADLMTAKVRELIAQLLGLGDSVKADDLQGRLKSLQQEAVRQLKDRQELFAGGEDLIQLGRHRFHVNTQPLDLTVVNRDGVPHLHLTSTKYFEEITDPGFLATRDVWDQEVVSENRNVYRGEYLAYQLLQSLQAQPARPGDSLSGTVQDAPKGGPKERGEDPLAAARAMSQEQRLAQVQEFLASRYQEGYTKGVHDVDGARIFEVLLDAHLGLQLARYHPSARAAAIVYWHGYCPEPIQTLWRAKLRGFSERNRLFPGDPIQRTYVTALQDLIRGFVTETGLFAASLAEAAGEYLFYELVEDEAFVLSQEASQLLEAFQQHLVQSGSERVFAQARESVASHPASELELVRDWVRGFLLAHGSGPGYLEEIAAFLFCGNALKRRPILVAASRVLENMTGSHTRIQENRYRFDYLDFQNRLHHFERDVVPRFRQFHQSKQELLDRERTEMRLEALRARVLTTFVRNQLIDQVYLPLIGDNLAKQIGAAGDQKRTDLMGLLLLVSPPGYGKTTLMEYVANRLGVVFVKINGPALGHAVTSLDPKEAPNAAAREEVARLNLALEMGDNVMICLDDIQHCSPEFLQKFISLCDAQRKIEGVWRGQTRTYDLRGRKVIVVMAGNPYTESGQKFKIPDMLANRADTYNLGDIIGSNADWFRSSYLENAVTSNPVLAPLANKSQKDIRAFIRMAESGERDPESLEGSYSPQEMEEVLAVLARLAQIRQTVLQVNQEYIRSAAQADEFRTEPAFKLQGSYRNMNRLAEKIVPVMNDEETEALLLDHYKNESQTLTTGAEANYLKFRALMGIQSPAEKLRWEEIQKTFRRNQLTRGVDTSDSVGRVVAQLSAFQTGLEAIQETLQTQLSRPTPSPVVDLAPLGQGLEALRAAVAERLSRSSREAPPADGEVRGMAERLTAGLEALRQDLTRTVASVHSGLVSEKLGSLSHELTMIHSTLATLKDLAAQHRNHLRDAQELLATRARQGTVEIDLTQEMLSNEQIFLEKLHEVLANPQSGPPDSGASSTETPNS